MAKKVAVEPVKRNAKMIQKKVKSTKESTLLVILSVVAMYSTFMRPIAGDLK